jgi:hypothetical protein
MKTYTREELEQLATESPNKLALLFAQKVAGFPDACIGQYADSSAIYPDRESSIAEVLPNYPTDWTAVINAGKKAGIECVISPTKFAWASTLPSDDNLYLLLALMGCQHPSASAKKGFHCDQQPNWPDCAALMIVMIEVMQK